jgi:hypothetical protein
MDSRKEKELQEIQKRMLRVNILASPGAVLLGFGLYGKFAANGNAFLSVLNDPYAVNISIIAGAIVMIWESVVVFQLLKRKAVIMSKARDQSGMD